MKEPIIRPTAPSWKTQMSQVMMRIQNSNLSDYQSWAIKVFGTRRQELVTRIEAMTDIGIYTNTGDKSPTISSTTTALMN